MLADVLIAAQPLAVFETCVKTEVGDGTRLRIAIAACGEIHRWQHAKRERADRRVTTIGLIENVRVVTELGAYTRMEDKRVAELDARTVGVSHRRNQPNSKA